MTKKSSKIWLTGFVAITGLVAAFITGFDGWYSQVIAPGKSASENSGKSPILPIPKRARTGNMVEFKLAGETFRFPDTRLYTIFQEDRNAKGELSSGFDLIGLGSQFEAKSDENIDKFIFNNNDIRVAVIRACRTHPENQPPPKPCTPERVMESSFRIFALRSRFEGEFISKDQRPDILALQIPNLEFIGFQNNPHLAQLFPGVKDVTLDKTVYRGEDSNGRVRFAVCTRKTDPWDSFCKFQFIWKNKFKIEMRMRAINADSWQEIWANVERIIENHTVTKDTQPPEPGIKVVTYPINQN